MVENQIEENRRKETITGLFVDVKAADLAARGLIALGLSEDQVKILDLPRLIMSFSPELAQQITWDSTSASLVDLDEDFIEDIGLRIADTVDLPEYLTDLGLCENEALYFAGKIRAGYVLLIATADRDKVDRSERLLDELGIQD